MVLYRATVSVPSWVQVQEPGTRGLSCVVAPGAGLGPASFFLAAMASSSLVSPAPRSSWMTSSSLPCPAWRRLALPVPALCCHWTAQDGWIPRQRVSG